MSNGNAYECRSLWTLINQVMQYHILTAYKICYPQPNNKSELSIRVKIICKRTQLPREVQVLESCDIRVARVSTTWLYRTSTSSVCSKQLMSSNVV